MDKQQSTLKQNILHEKIIYRYINALERGDLDTLASILSEAEQDENLARMIEDAHFLFERDDDVTSYTEDAALLHQLLQQYRLSESQQSIQASENTKNVSVAVFLRRLKEIGLDKDFIMQRLLPKSLVAHLQRRQDTEEIRPYILRASSMIERMFRWLPGTLFSSEPLTIDMAVVGTTRFKKNIHTDISRISAYTLYARYLALLVLKATEGLPKKPIPTQAHIVRQEVLSRYGDLTFEHVLQYVWSLGVPVLPLNDKGAFHGACWRFDSRNVIVLKQQTMSDARWLFDLLHELRHTGQEPQKDQFEIIEGNEMPQKHQQADEEKIASQFAGAVILDGQADALAKMCVEATKGQSLHGRTELLKTVVPTIAQREHVPVDVLANYLAFRLSLQNINWWGAAINLQPYSKAALVATRDVLLQQANFEVLEEDDRQLLLQALSLSEV